MWRVSMVVMLCVVWERIECFGLKQSNRLLCTDKVACSFGPTLPSNYQLCLLCRYFVEGSVVANAVQPVIYVGPYQSKCTIFTGQLRL